MPKLPSADFLHRLADIADRETLPRFRTDLAVDSKTGEGYCDPVTEADREAEIAMRAAIEAEYPDHAILGEELGLTGSGSRRWVLDPVDGTRPFICGLPVWGTLIGLTVDGRAEQGMMSQPFTRERFWATADGPGGNMQASVNDCRRETSARCRVPSCTRLRLSSTTVTSSRASIAFALRFG